MTATSSPRRRTLSITRHSHRRTNSSANEQTKAHVPTLKGLGKSDCEVKIVSILECESRVPVDILLDQSCGMSTPSASKLAFILTTSSLGCH
jgi:hypothetical protein